jgi:hypothetical protein
MYKRLGKRVSKEDSSTTSNESDSDSQPTTSPQQDLGFSRHLANKKKNVNSNKYPNFLRS